MTRLALVLASFLAACGTPEGRNGNGEGAAHTIGPDGAAGLAGQTPFTVPAMERAFPGLEVVSISDPETPAFHIRVPGSQTPLFVVTPDWTRGYAGAVATRSASVTGPDGLRAGVTAYTQLPESWRADCMVEPGWRDGPMTCERQSADGAFRLVFPPSRADPVLEEMVYLPPVP